MIACPHCGTKASGHPVRRFTCRGCGAQVHLRRVSDRDPPLLLSEEKALAFDMVVRRFGGRLMVWPILPEIARAVQDQDHHGAVLGLLERSGRRDLAVDYCVGFGLEHRTFQEQLHTERLELLRDRYPEESGLGVFVVNAFGACPHCRQLERQWISFEEAIRTRPLPCWECTTPRHHAPSFCRCQYFVARADEEEAVYMSGGNLMAFHAFVGIADRKMEVEYRGGPLDGERIEVREPQPVRGAGSLLGYSSPDFPPPGPAGGYRMSVFGFLDWYPALEPDR